MDAEQQEIFIIPNTVLNGAEWQELVQREFQIGPEALLDELLEQGAWSGAEMAWVVRRLLFYYGRKDELLKRIPVERMLTNASDLLRCLFLVLDYSSEMLDDNVRSYITSKLVDATWGVSSRTREYLKKLP